MDKENKIPRFTEIDFLLESRNKHMRFLIDAEIVLESIKGKEDHDIVAHKQNIMRGKDGTAMQSNAPINAKSLRREQQDIYDFNKSVITCIDNLIKKYE